MLRILLVEDHKWVSIALESLLNDLPNAAIIEHLMSENEALDWLENNKLAWDLVITDLAIGKGSGLQILEACKTRESHQKIIVLSNYLDDETKRQCFSLGANAVFEKASDVDEMFDYCRNISKIILQTHTPT